MHASAGVVRVRVVVRVGTAGVVGCVNALAGVVGSVHATLIAGSTGRAGWGGSAGRGVEGGWGRLVTSRRRRSAAAAVVRRVHPATASVNTTIRALRRGVTTRALRREVAARALHASQARRVAPSTTRELRDRRARENIVLGAGEVVGLMERVVSMADLRVDDTRDRQSRYNEEQSTKQANTHINQNPLIIILVRAREAHEFIVIRLAFLPPHHLLIVVVAVRVITILSIASGVARSTPSDLNLRARLVELGPALVDGVVQRDDFVPEEVGAGREGRGQSELGGETLHCMRELASV